ncbi:MAG: helix-turn-helix domain-containing protein [Actinomycetota bacterium]|nr:helix-turn-helix domain-containing protein [Actinomycetota bacterium]
MPPRAFTPSSYVGFQVRKLREQKGWSQQKVVDRLHELGIERTGWNQTKIHKLEAGKLARVLVDDVFELALAFDVSPLYVLTPLDPFDDEENALLVALGGKIARWPSEVRQWIRGVRPILNPGDYRDDEEARRGQRFYLLDSQPLSEWRLIAETGNYASRVQDFVTGLVDEESEQANG